MTMSGNFELSYRRLYEDDEYGMPRVLSVAGLSQAALPAISISHKPGFAVAVAVNLEPGFGVGVDAEAPRAIDGAFLRGAFSEDERRLLSPSSAMEDSDRALSAWCAKEAFAKALGTGFSGMPTNVVLREIDASSHRFEMMVGDKLAELRPEVAGLRTPVYALRLNELFLAACVCRNR